MCPECLSHFLPSDPVSLTSLNAFHVYELAAWILIETILANGNTSKELLEI